MDCRCLTTNSVGHLTFYGMVYHGISLFQLHFLGIHTRLMACVYTKEMLVTCGVIPMIIYTTQMHLITGIFT